MEQFRCSDSLGDLLYPREEKNQKDNLVYSREFQAMLDGLEDEDSVEESGPNAEKKRRLGMDQVKALEKVFEMDNKLDPERKVILAHELGLQPRQVAIWFQNRRARWKTKQLERDYNHLKANYEALKLNYNKLQQERETLIAELRELKGKVGEENTESNQSEKEKALFLESHNNVSRQSKDSPIGFCGEPEPEPIHEVYNNKNLVKNKGLVNFKDRLSESDSSGILNEDSNLNAQLLISQSLSSPGFGLSSFCSSSQFLDSRPLLTKADQQQLVKMEEQCLFSSEESCNIFSVDEVPRFCWYFPDQRN